jgi:hypothetical protein
MACATFVRRILIPIFVLGLAVAHAQTITKVSGDGQLAIQAVLSSSPMVVLVRDASGKPLPNAKVTWSVSPTGQGGVISGTTETDANGDASNTFVASVPNPGVSYVTSTVTAAYGGQSVQFTEISVGQTGNTPNVQVFVTPQPATANLSGPAGGQGTEAITIQFLVTQGAQAPGGVSGAGVTATLDNPQNSSTAACAGGTVYSNGTGFATCNLVYGGKIGAGSFTLSAGGLANFDYRFEVVAGPPNTIVLLTGNNSTGIPGQEFTLTAKLTDVGGNTLSGVPMTWSAVVPGTVTIGTPSSTTDTTGRVSTTVTLGNSSGPVQVKLATADGKVSALFNLTVNVVVAGLNMVSGSGQSALENQPFTNPLIVQVNDAQNAPVTGVPVTFTLSSGSAVLSAGSVNTSSNGQAAVTVTAGATAGPVVIIASTTAGNNTYSQTFNLTVTPPGPVCDALLSDKDTFFNGASFAPNFISPGGIALIYCQGIANGIQGVVTSNDFGFGPLPTQVQGVTVQFNPPTGPFSPIYYLANQNDKQWIAVQVPFETPPNTPVTVVVTANGEPNVNPLSITLPAGAPGFLEYVMSDGKSRAILLHSDGSVVDVDKPQHMAQPGETLTAFVTGLIPPTNSSGTSVIQTNEFAPPGSDVTITTPIVMGVGHEGTPQPPTAKYAHDLIGVWEVTFVVPSDASGGDNALNIGIPDPTNNNKLILNKRGSVIPIN